MKLDSKIYIAGHRGMVGSAICRSLAAQGFENQVKRTHRELPLENGEAVEAFFAAERPKYVFVAAAKVGGIAANVAEGATFIRQNLLIQTHVIDAAYRHGARKLLFLGSSCIYPKLAEQPIREDALLTGPLEPTNLPYAVAKIAGTVMCDAYRAQHGFDAFTVMPSNVYGIGDNFDPTAGHVVAGLMRRIFEARQQGASEMVGWGTGTPQRELTFADDLADACVFLMQHYEDGGLINVGSGHEVTIAELAQMIAEIVGFTGSIQWDASKPDGTPRKIMDSSHVHSLGWRARTPLRAGLEKMYDWARGTGLLAHKQEARAE
jgi:GDP-L-fucose synthase